MLTKTVLLFTVAACALAAPSYTLNEGTAETHQFSFDLSNKLSGIREKLSDIIRVDDARHTGFNRGPPPVVDLTKYTIAEILNYSLSHEGHGHLKKLAYVINKIPAIQDALNDTSATLTLFAPDDRALTPPHRRGDHGPPHRRHGHHGKHGRGEDEIAMTVDRDHPFFAFDDLLSQAASEQTGLSADDDEDKEKRKEKLRKIATYILKYHVAPKTYSTSELADSATIETILEPPRFGKDEENPHFRLRTEPTLKFLKPTVRVNFYAAIVGPQLNAKNGVIHIIDEPLLPPLGALSVALAFPDAFSAFSSAQLYTGIDELLAPWLRDLGPTPSPSDDEVNKDAESILREIVHEQKDKYANAISSYTLFAPTNGAFKRLPTPLKIFLFSPFGRGLLKRALYYHVVPHIIFHSDHISNLTDVKTSAVMPTRLPVEGSREVFEQLRVEAATLFGQSSDCLTVHGKDDRPSLEAEADKVEKTTFTLPTLFKPNFNNTGETSMLEVDLYKYRLLYNKGPIARRLYVGGAGEEEHDEAEPAKTYVIAADVPAWTSAIHVIPTLLKPPFNISHEHEHASGRHPEEARFERMLIDALM
ncbi:uncharacterized protein L969DRAFT_90084 [Mixia osmundae IAM 14324]|uniref:FAS1 domain-containing protein n=1 Tax=Mixia osmundae (strain CBS 9802 / IAM 14324 / JCM 22182 / KY 12970) TaxID=764103 RepID=G7EAX8_MIXOS|nr:uncharacterized protein L969DRAFT_90084 [Mixia osmundae IAM 14324]KEI37023.1 hypothetical protein L969DRAFT_90084 [Mixia osmundae IAM 14324]GAA99988.1 hypothetical protein E5Q_06691 [Mixia osmundae IAM 14324]